MLSASKRKANNSPENTTDLKFKMHKVEPTPNVEMEHADAFENKVPRLRTLEQKSYAGLAPNVSGILASKESHFMLSQFLDMSSLSSYLAATQTHVDAARIIERRTATGPRPAARIINHIGDSRREAAMQRLVSMVQQLKTVTKGVKPIFYTYGISIREFEDPATSTGRARYDHVWNLRKGYVDEYKTLAKFNYTFIQQLRTQVKTTPIVFPLFSLHTPKGTLVVGTGIDGTWQTSNKKYSIINLTITVSPEGDTKVLFNRPQSVSEPKWLDFSTAANQLTCAIYGMSFGSNNHNTVFHYFDPRMQLAIPSKIDLVQLDRNGNSTGVILVRDIQVSSAKPNEIGPIISPVISWTVNT